jgi:uncharacterized radical SAM superfamily Fe-S cluster-containing enzyme
MRTVPAKIVQKDGAIYLLKHCAEHGQQLELLEEDAAYQEKKQQYNKPGTVSKTQTQFEKGCPFDCGLCPEHDQHTCIGLIEVTNSCDLQCPVCYANAQAHSPENGVLALDTIEAMMDFYQDSEGGQAEILQISGGEPTTHPGIVKILQMARAKRFKYLMLNTNGIRIAEDEDFVRELKQFDSGFEVYLQFDGFSKNAYQTLRGRDLADIKKRALANLSRFGVPSTLVCTVAKGVNDLELGEIIATGIQAKSIRGVNFQPVAYWGRLDVLSPAGRITTSGVLKRIAKQTNGMIALNDFVPLPCNVERVAITFLFKTMAGFIPITRNVDIKKYLSLINNTFAFKIDEMLKTAGRELLNPLNVCKCFDFFKDYRKVVPADFDISAPDAIENTFRISVTSFVDAYNFDHKSMQKECVHIITPDFKRIPFSAYNMLYREQNQC